MTDRPYSGQGAERLAKDVIDQVTALAGNAAQPSASQQAGELAQGIAGRLGSEASEVGDQYTSALRDLGLTGGRRIGMSHQELTHPTRLRQSFQHFETAAESEAENILAGDTPVVTGASSDEADETSGVGQDIDVEKLAELVYRLMQEDLQVEMERTGRYGS